MQSSSFQDLAAMRPSMLVIRNPKFANIGLCPGNSQVLMIYGILEMAPAVMEAKNAQLLPLANQKITQIITNTAMKLSKPDQQHLPLISNTKDVAVEPNPQMMGIAGLKPFFFVVQLVIQAIIAHKANVENVSPSPVPFAVECTRYEYVMAPATTLAIPIFSFKVLSFCCCSPSQTGFVLC